MAKKSLIGFEVELFTLDENGFMIDAADKLLKKCKDKQIVIKKECCQNTIEIASYPDTNVPNTMQHLLLDLEHLAAAAKKENVLLCPLGTYPGAFNPKMRTDQSYRIKESIFGKNRWKIAGRCAGFHCHYDLPHGMFDSQLRILRMLVSSKAKDSLVNSHNLIIASDPAITCFMQSSPFYQGRFIGKDSRIIMYRGGSHLNSKSGLYSNFEEFGGLPHYKLTALDIMDVITTRYEKWKSYIKKLGINIKVLSLYGSILDTNWGPLKINPHGTLEIRGSDMNHPNYIAGCGVLVRSLMKKIQEGRYSVVPSEIGIKEPFRVEKDVIHVPPFPYVRDVLQYLSAYKGLEEPLVYKYCRNFLELAKTAIEHDNLKLILPFYDILRKKKTISDEILDYAKKRGFDGEKISSSLAAQIAVLHSEKLMSEAEKTKELISNFV